METKFTKGEWEVIDGTLVGEQVLFVHVNGNGVVCILTNQVDAHLPVSVEGKANAHLIAAAPEMYHMLNRVIQAQKDADNEIEHSDLLHFLYDDIEKLLAKARG